MRESLRLQTRSVGSLQGFPRAMTTTRALRRLLLTSAILCCAAWRPGRKRADAEEDKVPDTDGLIGLLAHTIYQYFDRPKYHVSVYLTFGSASTGIFTPSSRSLKFDFRTGSATATTRIRQCT